jgi:hypothetical protein
MSKDKKEIKERFMIGEIATQHAPVIVDTENENKVYTDQQILAKILNNQEKLMKLLD